MKQKAGDKFIWLIELGAVYILGLKSSFLLYSKSALWVYFRLHFL